MTRVMICGTRRPADIGMLAESGVDAIGLITEVWQKIACNLTRDEARALSHSIPPTILSVLILTQDKPDEIIHLAEYVSPDVVQVHGFNAAGDVAFLKARLRTRIIKTLHLQGERMAEGDDPLACARQYIAAGADAILLDSYSSDKVGGTGELVSLAVARNLREGIDPIPLILAGGLKPENVGRACAMVKPYAVDAFSSVTTEGYLDAEKVKRFIKAVQNPREMNDDKPTTG